MKIYVHTHTRRHQIHMIQDDGKHNRDYHTDNANLVQQSNCH